MTAVKASLLALYHGPMLDAEKCTLYRYFCAVKWNVAGISEALGGGSLNQKRCKKVSQLI